MAFGTSRDNDNSVGANGSGAVLLVVSGKPRQALLSWLSGHVVELPPLPSDALKEAVTFAFENHYQGDMLATVW